MEVPTLRQNAAGEWHETNRPTYLIGQPVCQGHRETFKLRDWVKPSDWAHMEEVARSRGYHTLLVGNVKWATPGWRPEMRYLELERTR